ncbi:hypothetical protein GCM10009844_31660 [Nocardioides koreensis]|uniref:Fumarate reductase subunit D n=1 Tax=Nocardioides koreensis TaxID=433651 RepID=A0ABN2ZZ46_9ACTN
MAGVSPRATVTTPEPDRAYRWAWLSLALYPLAVAAAFVVGEGLASLYGYESGSEELAPWWVALGAGGPALLVLALPIVVTFHFGRRAVAGGRPVAKVPMYVGAGLVALFVLLNLVSYVVGLLVG